MNRKLVLSLFLWFSSWGIAQNGWHVYTWEEALKLPKDSVLAIDASKLKWDSLPEELYTYTLLRYLNISKNRLKELPTDLSRFKYLAILDASRNKFETFPVGLCQMTQLKKLSLSRNLISTIPACIGYFNELTYLDLWDNPISGLPNEFMELSALKTVDLRGILFSPTFQEKWKTNMPGVRWYFDPPCDCME